MATTPTVSDWLEVKSRTFRRYNNAEGNESVLVEFAANDSTYRIWLSMRMAKHRSDKFWVDHTGKEPCPRNVEEWLQRQEELNSTAAIQTRPKGKFFETVGIKPGNVPTTKVEA